MYTRKHEPGLDKLNLMKKKSVWKIGSSVCINHIY